MNLILNNLVHSLPNVVHDDSLVSPRHLNARKDNIATFDYIVSNPPFNMDFSDTRDQLADEKYKKRFFAGVPNIPKKKMDSMDIYLMFLQHIIVSMNEYGKAAVVVPTGFLTASKRSNKIAYNVRKHLLEHHWLRGVISMPSQIFANTGTNVSVLFIDKEHTGDVILMDASKLGHKVKVDDNQRTVLEPEEINRIIEVFNQKKAKEDFSIVVSEDKIKGKNYSYSAGQYFEVKIEYIDLTPQEFAEKMRGHQNRLQAMFNKGHDLENEIKEGLRKIYYERNKEV